MGAQLIPEVHDNPAGRAALEETRSVILDDLGSGQVCFRPADETWHPEMVQVSASSHRSEARCRVVVPVIAAPASYIDGTMKGSSGDQTGEIAGHVLAAGQTDCVWAVWEDGDPGAVATAVLTGTRELQ